MRAAALAALVAGCGGDEAGAVDAGSGSVDAAACPAADDPAPTWLAASLDDDVARLAGERELVPGVTLVDRATPARRAEVRDYLLARLTGLGLAPTLAAYDGGANVVAEIAPTVLGDAAWLVLGAHLDTVATSPGANDDATGVAVVLAAARYLSAQPCRRRGVIVALFDQEEIGLVGSGHLAGALIADGRTIVEAHTVDQVGWDDDGDRAIELESPPDALLAGYQAAADGLAIPVVATATTSSDHHAFRVRGIAAVGVSEEFVGGDTTPYYHSSADRHDTVDLAYLTSAASLVNAVLGRSVVSTAVTSID